jgi:hypothetical protein
MQFAPPLVSASLICFAKRAGHPPCTPALSLAHRFLAFHVGKRAHHSQVFISNATLGLRLGSMFGLYAPSESTTISAVVGAASLVPKRYRILTMDSEVALDVSWSNT